MHVAHAHGIIHRDLKPANILLPVQCHAQATGRHPRFQCPAVPPHLHGHGGRAGRRPQIVHLPQLGSAVAEEHVAGAQAALRGAARGVYLPDQQAVVGSPGGDCGLRSAKGGVPQRQQTRHAAAGLPRGVPPLGPGEESTRRGIPNRIAIAQGFQGHCRHPARRAHHQPADALRNEPVEPRWCGLYRSKWACRQESDKTMAKPGARLGNRRL